MSHNLAAIIVWTPTVSFNQMQSTGTSREIRNTWNKEIDQIVLRLEKNTMKQTNHHEIMIRLFFLRSLASWISIADFFFRSWLILRNRIPRVSALHTELAVPMTRGGGGTQQIFILGGSVPRSNSLPFYTPFFTKKVPHSYTFHWQTVPLSYTSFRTLHPF